MAVKWGVAPKNTPKGLWIIGGDEAGKQVPRPWLVVWDPDDGRVEGQRGLEQVASRPRKPVECSHLGGGERRVQDQQLVDQTSVPLA